MPKEIIVDATSPGSTSEDRRQGVLQVGWQRGLEHLQVATFARDRETFETINDAAFYVTLSRHDVNEFIRHLRRARDQAFGRDE